MVELGSTNSSTEGKISSRPEGRDGSQSVPVRASAESFDLAAAWTYPSKENRQCWEH